MGTAKGRRPQLRRAVQEQVDVHGDATKAAKANLDNTSLTKDTIERGMPKVSSNQHYWRYRQLRQLWSENQSIFGMLSPTEQWALHDYYRPSHELSELEHLAHRGTATGSQNSLPNRAGKAWALMEGYWRGKRAPPRSASGQITARLIVRPEIDVRRLAQVLLQLAKDGRA